MISKEYIIKRIFSDYVNVELPVANGRPLEFSYPEGGEAVLPELPLEGYGEIWHTGWDIPTQYCVDANLECWMDSAHGGSLRKVKKEVLLTIPEDDTTINVIRKLLHMEPLEPSWMQAARNNGWTPPKDKQ